MAFTFLGMGRKSLGQKEKSPAKHDGLQGGDGVNGYDVTVKPPKDEIHFHKRFRLRPRIKENLSNDFNNS